MPNQAAIQDSLIGLELGHCRILEKVGSGGMGVVYRAHDEHLDREVAIKVLRPGSLTDEFRRRRLHKEALALSKLNHPNIATIYDFDTQQEVDFLVMEYIQGITLSEKLAGGPLPEHEVFRLGIQLVEGLAAAHEQGVLHRDLKPGNLRLTSDGRLKILDFGLAKVRQPLTASVATESTLESSAITGTLAYMAPEQLYGQEIDARADIYAAGLVLYEMATGQRPFAEVESSHLIGAILRQSPLPPTTLNPKMSPELARIIGKCLEKEPEKRYQLANELTVDLRRLGMRGATASSIAAPRARRSWTRKATVPAALIALAAIVVGGALYRRSHSAHALTPQETIVLADFVNTTGDPVFDDTLKQALLMQLEQSPFLNVVPEARVQRTMRLMDRSPGERLTPDQWRELCERTGSKAIISGLLASVGSQYVVGLNVEECGTGRHLVSQQVQVKGKEEVLKGLGGAATSLRTKLGESLGSIQKFDLPLAEVTTSSLEALQAYSRGLKIISEKGQLAAIPFFERAIELDPNFAMAYRRLGVLQMNLAREDFGIKAIEKAFSLRDRVSERERLDISELYYLAIPGDYERSNQIARQWAKTYPNDSTPHMHLGLEYGALGRWPEAITEEQEAVRLDPDNAAAYQDLATYLLQSNQPEAAEMTITQALSHNVDPVFFRWPVYQLAFLRGDARAMEQVLAEVAGTGNELLPARANTEAYYGRLARARQFWRRAVELERRTGSPLLLGGQGWLAALHEAELGNFGPARLRAADALAGELGWGKPVVAALALARAGDAAKAQVICRALQKDYPSDTQLRVYWLPVVKGAIQITKGDWASAVAVLEEARPYELGAPGPFSVGTLYPAYLRGQAYLQAHDGTAAAAEFQKFLDHRTLVLNFPLGALAHLQLGRAYVLQGDTSKAKAAYQDFLTLWKDADPDIPILKQAKAEYGKLQ